MEDVFPPIKTSCSDHEGSGSVKVAQWDGKKWFAVSKNWISGDKALVRKLLEDSSAAYAKEKGITLPGPQGGRGPQGGPGPHRDGNADRPALFTPEERQANREKMRAAKTPEERAELIRESTVHLGNAVCVATYEGLTVEVAARINASMIVKSARTGADFEIGRAHV